MSPMSMRVNQSVVFGEARGGAEHDHVAGTFWERGEANIGRSLAFLWRTECEM